MIKCHLSKLMGVHRLTIQDVHEKTGLSRTTISNIYHEKLNRIDYDTLNKFCALFGCTVCDLLEYMPD